MTCRGCSLPANASGFDPHRASISSRFPDRTRRGGTSPNARLRAAQLAIYVQFVRARDAERARAALSERRSPGGRGGSALTRGVTAGRVRHSAELVEESVPNAKRACTHPQHWNGLAEVAH
jgi:DNA invertase Pin-like site-specific DNA recombinase